MTLVLEQALTAAGYDVLTANDGNSAPEIFQKQPDSIDLLVTDVVLSPMMGTELLFTQRPDLDQICEHVFRLTPRLTGVTIPISVGCGPAISGEIPESHIPKHLERL